MTTRWTPERAQEVLDEYNRKMGLAPEVTEDIPDDGPEARLAGKIMKWAKDHGYPCQ